MVATVCSAALPPDSKENGGAISCSRTIKEIIVSHFDSYQRDEKKDSISKRKGKRGPISANVSSSAASLRAATIREDILQWSLAASMEGMSLLETAKCERSHGIKSQDVLVSKEVSSAVVLCIDSAMACVYDCTEKTGAKKQSWAESVKSVLELAASIAGTGGDEIVARDVARRVSEFTCVDSDWVRKESCHFLGWYVGYLIESPGIGSASLRKNNTRKLSSESAKSGTNDALVDAWRQECLLTAGRALLPRLRDKTVKVRNAAVVSCSSFFGKKGIDSYKTEELIDMIDAIVTDLIWIASNDSSSANRATVAQLLPGTKNAVPAIVERVNDIDEKVREAALDNLRDNVNIFDLTEDQRINILRTGLTKRYPSTRAKTVELLCCSWMKSAKFDPIILFRSLNPVVNEVICESAANVIIDVANSVAFDETNNEDAELVRKHLSVPECRSFQERVLRALSIVSKDGTAMDPSMALFLRTKSAFLMKSTKLTPAKKSEAIGKIIVDIPTLCAILQKHLDEVTAINDRDGDLDEDETDVLEDSQNFICLQLIRMAEKSELEEEGSRRHFVAIMRGMLSRLATPDELVDACVKAMATAHDTEAQFLQTLSEVLADIEDSDHCCLDSEQKEEEIIDSRQMRVTAVLSFVLENISSKMATNPILEGFSQHLSPAITSNNALLRECGVNCLSKFALISKESTVLEEFKPLLLKIAGNNEERIEVRAQALMAICDLALIHEQMLTFPIEGNGEFETFQKLLLQLLSHTNAGIVIIAAEVTSKLLLAGRFHDPNLVAWLLTIYFDASIGDDDDDIKRVGSHVRLQQLLSIFFPAYSMSSLEANDALMASVRPTLSVVNEKMTQRKRKRKTAQLPWPIAKMVEFICYSVDLADKNKRNDTADAGAKSEDAARDKAARPTEDKSNDNDVDGGDQFTSIEASSTLLASIDIAEFLKNESDSAPTPYIRALAKILACAQIDVKAEETSLLWHLKSTLFEVVHVVDDSPALQSLERLIEQLEECDDEICSDEEDQEESDEQSDDEVVTKAMANVTLEESREKPSRSNEKENSLRCSVSMKETVSGEPRRRSPRFHLAPLN